MDPPSDRPAETRTPLTAPPTFTPPCGPITGWADRAVLRATGIPYAHAHRFSAPTPVADWSTPLAATSWSPGCPQAPVKFFERVLGATSDGLDQDEHCQHLSITLPTDVRPGAGLPVMVWIHGGSYASGAGDLAIMDPAPLVAQEHLVVVSVTYRLGLFGYLGDGGNRPANLGLLDQIAALRWVQRNIAAFGGNPGNVTVFGQSAGGDAVAHLMATPEAAGLLRRAIIQSAPLGITRGRAKMYKAMAEATRDVTPEMPAADVVARQTAATRRILRFGLKAAMPFGTQYGHDPLPSENAVPAAWEAVAPDIDVLIGHTSEEVRLFLPTLPAFHRITAIPLVGELIRRAVVAAFTTAVYTRPAKRFARRHTRAGGRAHRYLITFSAPGNDHGAAHTIDLPLLFGDEKAWQHAELIAGATWAQITEAATALRHLWAEFARGHPLPDRGDIPGVLHHRRA
ncbi:carboxylesterase family protein [Saccharopolyspora sp. WRP15-2]|uniref:Carboxylic ester hydrolase n=1 Tax=Saccharopolyspora oryzae TaxID=2997343 RepID=A0ABT4V0Z0_9PSEU|nr:carboxylesterase family protein [Saccharopolyspora oryzae]MDA3627622.1 carboxylesterase family protein [Saccharopolyspora oryzae]